MKIKLLLGLFSCWLILPLAIARDLTKEFQSIPTTDSYQHQIQGVILIPGFGAGPMKRIGYLSPLIGYLKKAKIRYRFYDETSSQTHLDDPEFRKQLGQIIQTEFKDVEPQSVVIVGHSLGGTRALNFLANQSQNQDHSDILSAIAGIITIQSPFADCPIVELAKTIVDQAPTTASWLSYLGFNTEFLQDFSDQRVSGWQNFLLENKRFRVLFVSSTEPTLGMIPLDPQQLTLSFFSPFSTAHDGLLHGYCQNLMPADGQESPFVGRVHVASSHWAPGFHPSWREYFEKILHLFESDWH